MYFLITWKKIINISFSDTYDSFGLKLALCMVMLFKTSKSEENYSWRVYAVYCWIPLHCISTGVYCGVTESKCLEGILME